MRHTVHVPVPNETRVVWRFVWIPTTLGISGKHEWRWLEWANVRERYMRPVLGRPSWWMAEAWAD